MLNATGGFLPRKIKFWLSNFIIVGVIGGVLAIALLQGFEINFRVMWRQVQSTNLFQFLFALSLFYLGIWIRGIRWWLISRGIYLDQEEDTTLPGPNTFALVYLLGFFVNAITFLRIGYGYRAWAVARESGTSFYKMLGTVVAERFQDVASALILILIISGILTFTSETEVPGEIILVTILLVAVLVGFLGLIRFGGRLAAMLPNPAKAAYGRIQTGTMYGLKPQALRIPVLVGLMAWVIDGVRFYLVALSLGTDLTFGVAAFAALAAALLATAPTPGGLGVVEGGLTGILVLLGLHDTEAFALTIVDRFITFLSILILGGSLFVIWEVRKVRYSQAVKSVRPDNGGGEKLHK